MGEERKKNPLDPIDLLDYSAILYPPIIINLYIGCVFAMGPFYLVFSAMGVLSDFLHCFLLRVRKEGNHFPLKVEFRATAKPAGGFPGSVLRFHRRRPGWEPFLAPNEFLTTEHNTLSGKCFAKSKACPYSRDLIRTIKGFLFFKVHLHFSRIHSPPLPLQHELYLSPRPFRGAA